MKLRHIKIENFRGIKDLEFNVGDITVFIGENNTGKTAILDAMKYALREVRSNRGCNFNSYDFHLCKKSGDPADAPPILIELTFREDSPGEWSRELSARLNRAKIGQLDKEGHMYVILRVSAYFDKNSNDYVQNWEFLNNEKSPVPNISPAALSLFQEEVSYYYLAALRDAAKHFNSSGAFWKPFLKESELSPELKAKIEEKLAETNDLIISSHDNFSKVTDRIKEIQKVISMAGGEDIVSVDAVPGRIFDILSKAQVNLNADSGAKIPVYRHGEGTQSLAVLTLFNAFLEIQDRSEAIVVLEEPESHLHPCAIRALWQLINDISGQKFISTHSGDLLSEVPLKSIVRLSRKDNINTVNRMSDLSLEEKELKDFNYHVRATRGELLFARCWILAEGKTEMTLIPELARVLDKPLERMGIRCIEYRNSDIGYLIKVADHMGISWVVLTDNDFQGSSDQKKVREALGSDDTAGSLFVMEEKDMEHHLCNSGYLKVYESFLSTQNKQNVKVKKGEQDYIPQLIKAVKGYKIPAIHKVIEEINNGSKVPPLVEEVIDAAIKKAE